MTVTAGQIAAAKKAGLTNVEALAAACDRHSFPFHLACTILAKETGGRNIYGHDKGGVFSTPGKDVEVTEANYREFRKLIDSGRTSNGVGPMQLTWKGFFPAMDKLGLRPWVPADNIEYGVSLLESYYVRSDFWHTAKSYNGGDAYADDAVAQARRWKTIVGSDDTAPPTPPSGVPVTTAQIRKELAHKSLDPDARRIWTEALGQPEFAKVEVIWGYGSGPDHNNGRCCDFMITIAGVPRAEQIRIGDGIHAYFKRNAKRLHVEGEIWNRTVTGFPSQGSAYLGPEGVKRAYHGPKPHTDHVHVQVSGKAPTSWLKAVAPGLPTTRVIYVDRLSPGQKDSDSVRWVQFMLRVPVTGTYDAATVAAVKAFQTSLGDDDVDGDLGRLQTAALVAKHADLGLTVEDVA